MTDHQETKFMRANEKFLVGDPISNEELNVLIDRYTHLETDLTLLGESFALARDEVRRRNNRLHDFKWSRNHRS